MPHPGAAKASPPGEAASQDPAARPAPAEPGAIRVEDLGGIDPDSAGILEPERGGLGLAMWQGTPRAVLETLLPQRSEEHTSELQSLMRNSYAVFCLKKKKIQKESEIEEKIEE